MLWCCRMQLATAQFRTEEARDGFDRIIQGISRCVVMRTLSSGLDFWLLRLNEFAAEVVQSD